MVFLPFERKKSNFILLVPGVLQLSSYGVEYVPPKQEVISPKS